LYQLQFEGLKQYKIRKLKHDIITTFNVIYFFIIKQMNNKDFLEQLILKVNPDLDDAGLEMMVSDAEPVLEEWVFTNIISTLNESQRAELIKLTDNKEYKS
jgi:hypothetical protein